MSFITEWMTNIIIFILLATIFDMLLPNSSLQKYTKMVIGLLLIAVIITPLFKLIASDFEDILATIPRLEESQDQNLESVVEMKKREIEESQHAYILEQMAVQLKLDAKEELMDQYGLEIVKIDFFTATSKQSDFPDNIEKMVVQLQRTAEKSNMIEVVKRVEINTDISQQSKQSTKQEEEIATILANKWDMANKVEVMIKEEVARGDDE